MPPKLGERSETRRVSHASQHFGIDIKAADEVSDFHCLFICREVGREWDAIEFECIIACVGDVDGIEKMAQKVVFIVTLSNLNHLIEVGINVQRTKDHIAFLAIDREGKSFFGCVCHRNRPPGLSDRQKLP
ncbi:hypothetical protein [Devosia sp. A449]